MPVAVSLHDVLSPVIFDSFFLLSWQAFVLTGDGKHLKAGLMVTP
jgi:hypothetical protein